MTDNKPAVIPTHDFTMYDLAKLKEHEEAGLPGMGSITETQMAKIIELYMSGKTYRQISEITGIKKVLILFASKRFHWFQSKLEWQDELNTSLQSRTTEAKMKSTDFMMGLAQFYERRIGRKMNQYHRTDNEAFALSIDTKEIDKYLKVIDMLYKVTDANPAKRNKAPAVGLNLGEGVTIARKEDGSVEITPKDKVASLVSEYAKSIRDDIKNKTESKGDKTDDKK